MRTADSAAGVAANPAIYGDDNAYCRNPDGGVTAIERIWCYTTDPDHVWDTCNFLSDKVSHPAKVAVDFLGNPWVITDKGDAYGYDGYQWQFEMSNAVEIAASETNMVAIINSYNEVTVHHIFEPIYLTNATSVTANADLPAY